MLLTGRDEPRPAPQASSFKPLLIGAKDAKSKKGGKQNQGHDMVISAKNIAETKRIVDCRLKQQRGEVVDMMGALGIKFSSVINMQVFA